MTCQCTPCCLLASYNIPVSPRGPGPKCVISKPRGKVSQSVHNGLNDAQAHVLTEVQATFPEG